jgi:16S rRNA processing protein RimM
VRDVCLIGAIAAPHGVRGALRVRSHSDVPGRFLRLDSILLGPDPGRLVPHRVTEASDDGHRVILHLEGVDTREAADELRGMYVYIDAAQMEAPPPGRHYVHDLVGCTVRNEAGEDRGRVEDVLLLPANDVYVVRWREREILVPAVPDAVATVDTAGRIVTVREMPGLFEESDED